MAKFHYNYKRQDYVPPHYLVPDFVMPPRFYAMQFTQLLPTFDVYPIYFLRLFGIQFSWRGFEKRERFLFSVFFAYLLPFDLVFSSLLRNLF
jgi:hypothetical protein